MNPTFKTVRFFCAILFLSTCGNAELNDMTDPDDEEKTRLVADAELPPELREVSGMLAFDDALWMINDGGNEPVLYRINLQNGTINREVYLENTDNIDWEEITQDEDYIYIGDFGNNSGNRDDLRILILDKSGMSADTVSVSGAIHFSYEDQQDFTSTQQNTPFDCEAFLTSPDSIFLFTKDWTTNQTAIYSLPKQAGSYQAKFKKRFDSQGLITGCVYQNNTKLALIGYRDYIPFLWIVDDFDLLDMDFSHATKYVFGTSLGIQTESIVFQTNGAIQIAAERTQLAPATLYHVQFAGNEATISE